MLTAADDSVTSPSWPHQWYYLSDSKWVDCLVIGGDGKIAVTWIDEGHRNRHRPIILYYKTRYNRSIKSVDIEAYCPWLKCTCQSQALMQEILIVRYANTTDDGDTQTVISVSMVNCSSLLCKQSGFHTSDILYLTVGWIKALTPIVSCWTILSEELYSLLKLIAASFNVISLTGFHREITAATAASSQILDYIVSEGASLEHWKLPCDCHLWSSACRGCDTYTKLTMV